MSFNITQPVKVVNPNSNVDSDYGTYADVAAANLAIPQAVREKGKTVGIIVSGEVVEYWYKSGITDLDLIPKVPRGVDILTESSTSISITPTMNTNEGTTIKETLERAFGNTIALNNEKVTRYVDNVITVSGIDADTGSRLSGEVTFTGILIPPGQWILLSIYNSIIGFNKPNSYWAQITNFNGGMPCLAATPQLSNGVKLVVWNLHPTDDITELNVKYIFL
jgi:hypothetical protein